MWNWAVGNDSSSLVSLSVNILHNPFCSMERIGSYLFRKLFILICPIIIFFGLQYRIFLRSDIKSLGSVTIVSSLPISSAWVITVSTLIFSLTTLDTSFTDNSFKTDLSFKAIGLSPMPFLWGLLVSVALSGDIMVNGVLPWVIDLPPEVFGESGINEPSENRCFPDERGGSPTA